MAGELLGLQQAEPYDAPVAAQGMPQAMPLQMAPPQAAPPQTAPVSQAALQQATPQQAAAQQAAAMAPQAAAQQQGEQFTCLKYGCLDVESPTNPCGCSDKCVKDGNCCADYQSVCAAVTPAKNPLLDHWQGCVGAVDPPMTPGVWQYAPSGAPVSVKIMSYNAEWWHIIEEMGGNGNSVGQTILGAQSPQPIDVIGMQEFYDPWFGFTRPGVDASSILNDYQWLRGEVGGPVGQIIGYRKDTWSLISRGQKSVAKDQKGPMDYGERNVFWVRLYHMQTGKTMLVANHHGPLPTNTGGVCGGAVTASNILTAIAEGAQGGDIVVLLGDFNADGASPTYAGLSKYLHKNFDGIDNIWTNLPQGSVVSPMQVGGGGSDHDAITAVLNVPGEAAR